MKSLLTLLCGLLVGSGTAAADDDGRILLAVADRHLIPAYAQLADRTAALHEAVTAQCRTAPGSYGEAVKRAFADAFLAWQGVQHIRFGPVQVLSRDFRFQLWPDKRGSVGKHLRRLLATRDTARLEADTFGDGSAAVQGFGALERLVHASPGKAGEDVEAARWRCRVSETMAANLARMARGTLSGWRDGDAAHRQMFATAGEGNDFYDDANELNGRLLNSLHTQLERLVDHKLGRPLGKAPGRALPKRAEAWRSGLSLAAVRGNVVALQQLYELAFASRLADADLHARIDARFAASLDALDAIDMPLARAVADADERLRVERAAQALRVLKKLVSAELAKTLGLVLGFNSLDGD